MLVCSRKDTRRNISAARDCTIARAAVRCGHAEAKTKKIMLTCSCFVSVVICRVSEGSEQTLHSIARLNHLHCPHCSESNHITAKGAASPIWTSHSPLLLCPYSPLNGPDMSFLYELHFPLNAVVSAGDQQVFIKLWSL